MKKLEKWWGESKTWQHVLLGILLVLFLYFTTVLFVRALNSGRILPGVSARGVYVGGLTVNQAVAKLDAATNTYLSSSPTYSVDGKTYEISPSAIGVSYDNQALANNLYMIGRSGNPIVDLADQTMAPFIAQDIMQINIDKEKYPAAMVSLNEKLAVPSQNASYTINGDSIEITPEKTGRRLDMGMAVLNLTRQMSELKNNLNIPTLSTYPDVTALNLLRQKDRISRITASPLVLNYGGKSWEVSKQQIVGWLSKDSQYVPFKPSLLTNAVVINQSFEDLNINKATVQNYLNSIAADINIEAVDAQLSVADGKAVVFKQSRDGKTLNIEASTNAILQALNGNSRNLELAVETRKAEVSDGNIERMGIKELISEGVTYFPGSPWNRLQNVRTGMSKFNGVLLKPDQVFSFGELLGEVGPAQGYAPGLIILGDHEEKAYGGGLCQVSSTAYRAALLAGLPILQRTNHAFAIDYYTAPFGVPGVDATIYYPQVDMKFKNDTGHYILIQTEMIGTTLKFRFYGTKTKSGNIRGPFFVSGSSDATKPSQTVFYRDVLDMNGKVIKTDTVNTYYKSSLDFPITD